MKEKYGIFTLSKQSSGYGTMYAITDANGRVYSSSYHAQDELKRLNGLQKTNPFSRFFGGGTTQYTILPIYSEPAGYTFGFGGFGGQQQEPQQPQSPYLKKIEYGVYKMESLNLTKIYFTQSLVSTSLLSSSFWYDSGSTMVNIRNSKYTTNQPKYQLTLQTASFASMSLAYDYIYNIPTDTLYYGENNFVILPVFKYVKPKRIRILKQIYLSKFLTLQVNSIYEVIEQGENCVVIKIQGNSQPQFIDWLANHSPDSPEPPYEFID